MADPGADQLLVCEVFQVATALKGQGVPWAVASGVLDSMKRLKDTDKRSTWVD